MRSRAEVWVRVDEPQGCGVPSPEFLSPISRNALFWCTLALLFGDGCHLQASLPHVQTTDQSPPVSLLITRTTGGQVLFWGTTHEGLSAGARFCPSVAQNGPIYSRERPKCSSSDPRSQRYILITVKLKGHPPSDWRCLRVSLIDNTVRLANVCLGAFFC